MPTFAVAACPVFEPGDSQWIDAIRARNDPQAAKLPPHVTLVFPAEIASPPREEIAAVVKATPAIPFVLRWARAIRSPLSEGGHVFLVPDEGFDQITALHRSLYRGAFAPSRRSDITFIPHVTVAANRDFAVCERIARELSPLPRLIQAGIQNVDLMSIDDQAVKSIGRFALEG